MPAPAPSLLRVGIVGAGGIVRERHLPGLLRIQGVEIVSLCNSTSASTERFRRECLPDARGIDDWTALVTDPRIDVVWIGAPPSLHSPVSQTALEAGKHVFCQARMAMNLEEAEQMLAAARRHPSLVTMLCPSPRGMRGDLVMKKIVADGVIGPIHQVRLHSFHDQYLDPEKPAHWRQKTEISGLNVLTLGIYAEVLQRWLGRITRLQARSKILHAQREDYEVCIPDLVNVLCTFANGAEGVLEFSGVSSCASSDRLELYGSKGLLTYDFSREEIYLARRSKTPEWEPVEIPKNLAQDWSVEADFVSAVRSNGRLRPSPDFSEGVRYMRVVQAVADSLAEGREVKVPN